VYHGGRVQDELVLVDDDDLVGGNASPVVLEVYPDVEVVEYPGGGNQGELLVVDRVVVGGKASFVVLEVYPDVELVVGRVVVGGKASPVVLDVYSEDELVEDRDLVVRHEGRVQEDRVDLVDDEVVDGLRSEEHKSAHRSDHLGPLPSGSYPVGLPGELYVVVDEMLLQPGG